MIRGRGSRWRVIVLCSGMIHSPRSRSTHSQMRLRSSPGRQPVRRRAIRNRRKGRSLCRRSALNSDGEMIRVRRRARGFRYLGTGLLSSNSCSTAQLKTCWTVVIVSLMVVGLYSPLAISCSILARWNLRNSHTRSFVPRIRRARRIPYRKAR